MEEKKETVSVSGVVSEEMFQKFMAYHIKAINKVVMPVALSAFFLLVWLFVNVNWIVSLILILILWGIANWMLAKSIKSRATKEYNSNRQIRNEVFLTIDEEGIRQKRHNSETFGSGMMLSS